MSISISCLLDDLLSEGHWESTVFAVIAKTAFIRFRSGSNNLKSEPFVNSYLYSIRLFYFCSQQRYRKHMKQ